MIANIHESFWHEKHLWKRTFLIINHRTKAESVRWFKQQRAKPVRMFNSGLQKWKATESVHSVILVLVVVLKAACSCMVLVRGEFLLPVPCALRIIWCTFYCSHSGYAAYSGWTIFQSRGILNTTEILLSWQSTSQSAYFIVKPYTVLLRQKSQNKRADTQATSW